MVRYIRGEKMRPRKSRVELTKIERKELKVKSYPGKDNISYSDFVIPSTGELFTCKLE